jgi:hypothetical protein
VERQNTSSLYEKFHATVTLVSLILGPDFSLVLCFVTPLICVLPLKWEAKFYTRAGKKEKSHSLRSARGDVKLLAVCYTVCSRIKVTRFVRFLPIYTL